MFTVTHSIRAAIPLSTCCDVNFNEHTFNLHPYHTQHPTLALSAINLTAAHKIFHHKALQALPTGTVKASVPAASCPSLISCAGYILFNLNALDARSRKICANISYLYPNNGATFSLLCSTDCWWKFYRSFPFPSTYAMLLSSCGFLAYCFVCYHFECAFEKSDYWLRHLCLSNCPHWTALFPLENC